MQLALSGTGISSVTPPSSPSLSSSSSYSVVTSLLMVTFTPTPTPGAAEPSANRATAWMNGWMDQTKMKKIVH